MKKMPDFTKWDVCRILCPSPSKSPYSPCYPLQVKLRCICREKIGRSEDLRHACQKRRQTFHFEALGGGISPEEVGVYDIHFAGGLRREGR